MVSQVIRDSLLVATVGGVISLDRTGAFQVMASRPIVASPLIGLALGDIASGVIMGAMLELIFAGDIPVGRYVPLHETSVAAALTAFVITGARAGGQTIAVPINEVFPMRAVMLSPIALLFSAPVGKACQKADSLARSCNDRFFSAASAALEAGAGGGLLRHNMKGLGVFFLFNWVSLLLCTVPLLFGAVLLQRFLPQGRGLNPAFFGAIVLGIASAMAAVKTRHSLWIFVASALLTGVCMVIISGI
jgi:PTS system mannose-specific IIC component